MRKTLARWGLWFSLVNVLLFCVVMLSYVPLLPNFGRILYLTPLGHFNDWLFFVLAMLGQMALFAALIYVVALGVAFISGKKTWTFCLGVLAASLVLLFVVADTAVYHLYHLHLAGVVFHVFAAGVGLQVFALSWLEWALFIGLMLVLLLIESVLAWAVWRWGGLRRGFWVVLFFAVGLFVSYVMFAEALTTNPYKKVKLSNNHVLLIEAQLVPYYENILALMTPGHNALHQIETADYGMYVQQRHVDKPLNYPIHPLVCTLPKKHLNVLFVILDAWRGDMLTPQVTPNMYRFSQHAWQFTHNSSGGDCTRPGIFSLFYSIPENYWSAVLAQHKGAILVDQFLRAHYQMAIFRSASMRFPDFYQSVFLHVPNLQITTPGATSAARDREITKEFVHFVADRKKNKPFFGFLFYDESHNYCEDGIHYPTPFKPYVHQCDRLALTKNSNPIPYLNRYKNAVHFDDGLVGKVLRSLRRHQLLKNTVIIFTADHGEEFNDNHLGYWGHASNYSVYQVHTPMVVYWPGAKPRIFNYPTTHYDVAPFLLQRVLGCMTPVRDYSVGRNLLNPDAPSFFIVNSYVDYAVLTPRRIMRIYSGGNYAVRTRKGMLLPNAELNLKVLKKAFYQLEAYFKK